MKHLLAVLVFLIIWGSGRACDATELRDRVRQFLASEPVSVFDQGEPKKERRRRLDVAADAMYRATQDPVELAVLLTIMRYESNGAGYVARGCAYPEGIPEGAPDCDRGKSRSYWQLKKETCPAGWRYERGATAAVYVFAVCAVKTWRGSLYRCQGEHPAGDWAGGFSGYARSSICTWGPAAPRAKTLGVVLLKISR